MDKRDNVVSLAVYPRIVDRAARGRARAIAAGEDDSAYDAAMDDIENCPATTIEGVLAKFERLGNLLDHIEWGDETTPQGWMLINQLRGSISEALVRFASLRPATATP